MLSISIPSFSLTSFFRLCINWTLGWTKWLFVPGLLIILFIYQFVFISGLLMFVRFIQIFINHLFIHFWIVFIMIPIFRSCLRQLLCRLLLFRLFWFLSGWKTFGLKWNIFFCGLIYDRDWLRLFTWSTLRLFLFNDIILIFIWCFRITQILLFFLLIFQK